MRKQIFTIILLALFFVASCAATQTAQPTPPVPKPQPRIEPAQQISNVITRPGISDEVQGLLNKTKTKVRNIHYNYRGPQTGSNFYEFFVKGNKIKYIPWRAVQALDQKGSYDAIYIDTASETAQSYCEAAYCLVKGKKGDLSYSEFYLPTVFDWIDGMAEAKKVGEEVIDDRNTWKIEANNAIIWFDTFYGLPLKVDVNGTIYKYEKIGVNRVSDSDVNPSTS